MRQSRSIFLKESYTSRRPVDPFFSTGGCVAARQSQKNDSSPAPTHDPVRQVRRSDNEAHLLRRASASSTQTGKTLFPFLDEKREKKKTLPPRYNGRSGSTLRGFFFYPGLPARLGKTPPCTARTILLFSLVLSRWIIDKDAGLTGAAGGRDAERMQREMQRGGDASKNVPSSLRTRQFIAQSIR
ncbi:hypothetical protein IF1G_00836 [Cordyceps javanica]|uniref:Uncharacterized protein n=1 Tax=Cordyceps javanica TaxID=43265 RepID=A0A545VGQ7_9HYPO|nr:hypothetical protein IF1G_00836 [Cordyceps javanica]TQW12079.1 hypothetical protein IF2G_00810 [Cordyceps javanica]